MPFLVLRAASAACSPAWDDTGVGCVEEVPSLAVSFACVVRQRTPATERVSASRHGFKMRRVHAPTVEAGVAASRAREIGVVAGVVDHETGWDRSNLSLVHPAVDADRSSLDLDAPVAGGGVDYSLPRPARIRPAGTVNAPVDCSETVSRDRGQRIAVLPGTRGVVVSLAEIDGVHSSAITNPADSTGTGRPLPDGVGVTVPTPPLIVLRAHAAHQVCRSRTVQGAAGHISVYRAGGI